MRTNLDQFIDALKVACEGTARKKLEELPEPDEEQLREAVDSLRSLEALPEGIDRQLGELVQNPGPTEGGDAAFVSNEAMDMAVALASGWLAVLIWGPKHHRMLRCELTGTMFVEDQVSDAFQVTCAQLGIRCDEADNLIREALTSLMEVGTPYQLSRDLLLQRGDVSQFVVEVTVTPS
jgi:hypothetical protein